MSTLRAVGLDELETVTNALRTLGATGITVDVLGSVGHEYAYAVGYEAESGDDYEVESGNADDWMFTMPPRVTEFPDLNQTEEYTKEREAA